MAVRKQLLERELNKLGLRRMAEDPHGGGTQQEGQTGHPHAEDPGEQHGG